MKFHEPYRKMIVKKLGEKHTTTLETNNQINLSKGVFGWKKGRKNRERLCVYTNGVVVYHKNKQEYCFHGSQSLEEMLVGALYFWEFFGEAARNKVRGIACIGSFKGRHTLQ